MNSIMGDGYEPISPMRLSCVESLPRPTGTIRNSTRHCPNRHSVHGRMNTTASHLPDPNIVQLLRRDKAGQRESYSLSRGCEHPALANLALIFSRAPQQITRAMLSALSFQVAPAKVQRRERGCFNCAWNASLSKGLLSAAENSLSSEMNKAQSANFNTAMLA